MKRNEHWVFFVSLLCFSLSHSLCYFSLLLFIAIHLSNIVRTNYFRSLLVAANFNSATNYYAKIVNEKLPWNQYLREEMKKKKAKEKKTEGMSKNKMIYENLTLILWALSPNQKWEYEQKKKTSRWLFNGQFAYTLLILMYVSYDHMYDIHLFKWEEGCIGARLLRVVTAFWSKREKKDRILRSLLFFFLNSRFYFLPIAYRYDERNACLFLYNAIHLAVELWLSRQVYLMNCVQRLRSAKNICHSYRLVWPN